ncbi:MAG: ankyrin repeat domain-containing protein [Chloracidobacterium sp.]|nr:ankyrin repeat domain-containing protein [Chloracidobacterium sp.]
MKINEVLKLIIVTFFSISTVLAQTSSNVVKKPGIAACFVKHIKPAYGIVISSTGQAEFNRCTEPSPELCDISLAISMGNYDGIKCLIDAGYDFNVGNGIYFGESIPIVQASFYDSNMLELLFNSKIPLDLEITDARQNTPLYSVTTLLSSPLIHRPKEFSWENIYRSAELLLKKGAKPDPVRNGITPLIFQAEAGRDRFLELLLRYKASPNSQTPDGKTALMLATDKSEVIDLLLSNGADIYLKDNLGKTVIFYAVEGCQINKTLSLLRKDQGLLSTVDSKGKSASSYLKVTDSSSDCLKLKERISIEFPN